MTDPYLTPAAVREALAGLGIPASIATIYKWLRQQELPAQRVGKRFFVRQSALLAWIDGK